MNKAKELLESITNRLNNLYYNEDIYGVDFFDNLISDIEKLYHKDMCQIKIDLDMYEYKTYYREKHKLIPAGSWVYIHQDEGGVTLYDEEMEYCCDIDYNISPDDIFYE